MWLSGKREYTVQLKLKVILPHKWLSGKEASFIAFANFDDGLLSLVWTVKAGKDI